MITIENQARFKRALKQLPDDLHMAGVEGLHEALDDWLKRARKKAPEDIKFLKHEMKTEINQALLEGSLISNAYSRGFNYAYFLHEIGSKRGYKPKKAGASLEWLKDTEDPQLSWRIVDETVEARMRAKGW